MPGTAPERLQDDCQTKQPDEASVTSNVVLQSLEQEGLGLKCVENGRIGSDPL